MIAYFGQKRNNVCKKRCFSLPSVFITYVSLTHLVGNADLTRLGLDLMILLISEILQRYYYYWIGGIQLLMQNWMNGYYPCFVVLMKTKCLLFIQFLSLEACYKHGTLVYVVQDYCVAESSTPHPMARLLLMFLDGGSSTTVP
jgi:hypothetical protein